MHIWAKLSLACVPFAIFIIFIAFNGIFYNFHDDTFFLLITIALLIPMIGVCLALSADTKRQVFLLMLLNLSFYPIGFFVATSGCSNPPTGPEYWENHPNPKKSCKVNK